MEEKKRNAVTSVSNRLMVGSDTEWKPERKCRGALESEINLVLVHSDPLHGAVDRNCV